MRKIIGSKSYDTDTARKVAGWDNMSDVRDFHYFSETLYCKRTGEYFLHGEGGPLTRYAEPRGTNQWTGGERIMPLSFDEATAWAERHMDAKDYEAEFGQVDEGGDGTTRLNLRVTQSTADTLRRAAVERGVSLGKLVGELADELQGKQDSE